MQVGQLGGEAFLVVCLSLAFSLSFGGALSVILECHAPGCHRVGLHRTADGLYVLCHKHHPDVPDKLTLEHIYKSHAAAKVAQKSEQKN